MKAKGGGKFKARQDEDFVGKATPFVQPFLLLVGQPVLLFQPGQPFDLPAHRGYARHSVVVGDGYNVQFFLVSLPQPFQIGDFGFFVVTGSRGM